MSSSELERLTKNNIDQEYRKTTDFYHQHASVRKEVAERLISSLEPWTETLPPGPIIELGAGTGFVTQGLLSLFPDRELTVNDWSPLMITACKENINQREQLSFESFDAQQLPVDEPTYALTISSFLAHWFKHPAYTLAQWLEVTQPGGLLLAAFPGNESFPEWKSHAETLGIPFTGNKLLDTEEMVVKLSSDVTQVDYYEDTITKEFKSAADFFRHIKRTGAGQQLEGRHLSTKEMRMLIDHWDSQQKGNITVSCHVVFLAVKKGHTA